MTKQIKTIDGFEFKLGTQKLKIYELYKAGKTIDEISSETGYPINNVKWYVYKFKKLTGIVSESVPESTNSVTRTKNNLILHFKQEGNSLNLFVQTSKEFEDYLKSNHEITQTSNLFGENVTGNYYRLRVIENYLDDINLGIVYHGQLNAAVFRVPGISEGKTFRINRSLSQSQLKSALRKLILTYKNFYKEKIQCEIINIRAEVLEEID